MPAQLSKIPKISCCILFLFYSHFVIPQSTKPYKTFGFQKFEATVLSPYEMIHVTQENAQFVKSYIQKELEAYGLQLSSSPDIYVNIYVDVELEEQAIGGITIMPKPEYASFYEVGTLNVQLVDTIETKILWEGSRSMMLWKKKEKKIRKRVDNIVAKLFKNFDPSTLGN